MSERPQGGPTGFADWLRQRRLALEHRIPYLELWVVRFLRLVHVRPREPWQDTLRVFLDDLGQAETPDWQIRQAADAVSLYCGQFRPRIPPASTTAARPQGPAPSTEATAATEATKAARPSADETTSADPFDPTEALAELERLLRLRHYSPRTERTYVGWARRYFRYLAATGFARPDTETAKAYISYLATRRQVAASTQNQAFNALLFLHRHVLLVDLGDMGVTVRARRGQRLPVVLSVDEVRAVLAQLTGTRRLMLELIYGGGLRLSELIRLRVKDIDFDTGTLTVRCGKGDKDRVTLLPKRLRPELKEHLEKVRAIHERDLAAGAGDAPLPDALRRKYPAAGREWAWQFVFPSAKLSPDAPSKTIRRWHASEATVQTTMIYTHVLPTVAPALSSPLDEL